MRIMLPKFLLLLWTAQAFTLQLAVRNTRSDSNSITRLQSSPLSAVGPSKISDILVQTLQDETVNLGTLVQGDGDEAPVIVSCLSHFGDFNAWELTQQYLSAIDSGKIRTTRPIVLVGIGSIESAQQFAQDLNLEAYSDRLTLLADETGAVTEAMGCYRGWLAVDQQQKERYPHTDINPYLKLFGMVLGFGSPGTIGKVLSGYTGDYKKENGPAGRKWVVDSLLQGSDKGRFPKLTDQAFNGVSGESSLRAFELATLRLQTGFHIVSKWGQLGPKNGDLFTRMGGTFVFSKNECSWSSFDQGILCYADMEKICQVAEDVDPQKDLIVPHYAREMPSDAELAAEAEEKARLKAEEDARIQEEEEARLQAEEEARAKAEEEEEATIQVEEDARIQAEEVAVIQAEEDARIQAEEAAIIQAEEEARTKADEEAGLQAEEDASSTEDNSPVTTLQPDATSAPIMEEALATSKDTFQRALLAAILRNNKAVATSEEDALEPTVEPVMTAQDSFVSKDIFQRALLAATLRNSKSVATSEHDASDPTVEPVMTAQDSLVSKESFQRALLAAILRNSKYVATPEQDAPEPTIEPIMTVQQDKEAFQRTLLAAKLRNDKAPAASSLDTATPTVEPVVAVPDSPVLAEENAKEEVLLSRKKPKKGKKRKEKGASKGFGAKK